MPEWTNAIASIFLWPIAAQLLLEKAIAARASGDRPYDKYVFEHEWVFWINLYSFGSFFRLFTSFSRKFINLGTFLSPFIKDYEYSRLSLIRILKGEKSLVELQRVRIIESHDNSNFEVFWHENSN